MMLEDNEEAMVKQLGSISDSVTSDDDGGQEDIISTTNPGWADAMAKVLRMKKPKKTKSIVLSKAKKLNDISKTAKEEIQNEEGKKDTVDDHSKRQKQREFQSKFRIKPSILDRERDRRLNRIATKLQQKTLDSQLQKAGGSERKREKVMKSLDKRSFLNVLMGAAPSEPVDSPVKEKNIVKKEEIDDAPTWQVLRDDFMMETKRLKDWDKSDDPT
ncbi:hypothetical protein C0J52_11662 [Blattella germanica]|nr:hypothetical protein C0J52_11662 [Blattella germanica]